MRSLIHLVAVLLLPLMSQCAVRTDVVTAIKTNPGIERMMYNGPKVFIKSAALSSRQRSDLYEVYIPYRYIEKDMQAIVTMYSSSNVSGVIHLVQSTPPAGPVTIRGLVSGLSPGKHGIHINHLGDLRNDCLMTGDHYNPYNFTHGPPSVRQRHVGDLGNIEADQNGVADFTITDKMLTLAGSRSVIGRSIVIDQGEDDMGRTRQTGGAKTTNSGSPVACGVIGKLE